jgi:hypothetical protein
VATIEVLHGVDAEKLRRLVTSDFQHTLVPEFDGLATVLRFGRAHRIMTSTAVERALRGVELGDGPVVALIERFTIEARELLIERGIQPVSTTGGTGGVFWTDEKVRNRG